jgi:hypothetical protein
MSTRFVLSELIVNCYRLEDNLRHTYLVESWLAGTGADRLHFLPGAGPLQLIILHDESPILPVSDTYVAITAIGELLEVHYVVPSQRIACYRFRREAKNPLNFVSSSLLILTLKTNYQNSS